MQKKKILHIIPRFTTGGAERLVLQSVTWLESEYSFAVASVVGGGELEKDFVALGLPLFVAPKKQFGSLAKTKRAIVNFAKEFQPDIVHSHLFSADLLASVIKNKLPTVRWVSTQHNQHNLYSGLRKIILRRVLKKADKIVAVSAEVAEGCKNGLQVQGKKITTIPNAIDLPVWKNISSTQLLQTDTIHIAIVGRLSLVKGHSLLFEALSVLRGLSWQLHIFGAGESEQSLKNKAEQLKISEFITWHGIVDTLPQAYETIDLVVQPSSSEGMSLAVMEAMAAGRLLILTTAAATGLVKHKKTGLVVPVSNATALSQAIIYAADHRDEARAMAMAARVHALQNFSYEKYLNSWRDLYYVL